MPNASQSNGRQDQSNSTTGLAQQPILGPGATSKFQGVMAGHEFGGGRAVSRPKHGVPGGQCMFLAMNGCGKLLVSCRESLVRTENNGVLLVDFVGSIGHSNGGALGAQYRPIND